MTAEAALSLEWRLEGVTRATEQTPEVVSRW